MTSPLNLFIGSCLILAALCLTWSIAYRRGIKKGFKDGQKKIDLNSLSALRAFAFYQARERYRHICDIRGIDKDLKRMRQLGIVPPDVPLNVWLNIEGGNER